MSNSLDFSFYLREELQKRQSRNPGYSLRAFATTLGISSSYLSKLMHAKKKVSPETFLKIATRLGMPENEIETHLSRRPDFQLENMDFESLALDEFQSISDWHHFALLEAVTLEDFRPEPEWFAERLGISIDKARLGLERLMRLGRLTHDASGRVANKVRNGTTITSQPRVGAHREHERQVLQLAIEALDNTPIERRSQTSMTLAVPASRVKEAKEKIAQFRREMTALLQRRGKRDSVYHLSISFYPVTEPPKTSPPKEK